MQHRLGCWLPFSRLRPHPRSFRGVLCFFANSADSVKLNDDLVLALWRYVCTPEVFRVVVVENSRTRKLSIMPLSSLHEKNGNLGPWTGFLQSWELHRCLDLWQLFQP